MNERDHEEEEQDTPAGAPAPAASALTAQAVLAAVPDLWFVVGPGGLYLEVSREDHPSLVAPWPSLRGRRFGDVVPAALATMVEAAMARCQRHGGVERVEYALKMPDGQQRSFEARIVPIGDERWLYLTRDITEVVATHRALRESEARYERATRGSADGLWDWDFDAGTAFLSPQWKRLLGYGPDALPDSPDAFFDRLHPDDAPLVQAALRAHFEHGAPFDVEYRLRTRSGEYRWFQSRGEAERDAQGRPRRMAGSLTDVTVRRQIEEALRDSQAKYSAMFQRSPVGIVVTRLADGVVLEANEAMARMLGREPAEMLGRTSVEVGVWRRAEDRAAFVAGLAQSGHLTVEKLEMRHRQGQSVYARLSAQQLQIGGATVLLCAVTDLSDRHAAEQALQEQREAYAAVVDNASDAIVSVDVQGRVLMMNPAAERIFGRGAASLQGGTIDALLPSGVRHRHGRHIAGFASSGRSQRAMGAGRVQGLHADGHTIELDATVSQARVGGRQVLTAILRDVTERVHAEAAAQRHRQELSALAEQLMDQERRATRWLAQRLHDGLGQTLTALRLTIDRLAGSPGGADAEPIRRQARELADQAVAEVRQTLVDLRPSLLDEAGLVAALDNELAVRAARHADVDLLLDAPPALQGQRWPPDVEYACFMIAREAVHNALLHARPTVVRVTVGGGADALRVDVADDGIGFDAGTEGRRRVAAGHLGLVGMRERARAVGARLQIGRSADGGTEVRTEWTAPA